MGPAPSVYGVSFPRTQPSRQCPVAGCIATLRSQDGLRRHFGYQHPVDTTLHPGGGAQPIATVLCVGCTYLWRHSEPDTATPDGRERVRRRAMLMTTVGLCACRGLQVPWPDAIIYDIY